MVDFAVPFSPRTRTPPISGEILARIRARAMSPAPRTAVNGNFMRFGYAFLWVRAHIAVGWVDGLAHPTGTQWRDRCGFAPHSAPSCFIVPQSG